MTGVSLGILYTKLQLIHLSMSGKSLIRRLQSLNEFRRLQLHNTPILQLLTFRYLEPIITYQRMLTFGISIQRKYYNPLCQFHFTLLTSSLFSSVQLTKSYLSQEWSTAPCFVTNPSSAHTTTMDGIKKAAVDRPLASDP
ncbi:hypothetical protein PILCRDRAFT_695636 [Piloderma croceum F 1598]|uniref:Uncharacterized protein n=1 Tax=Piloderma croceum (strain F 1598) TaxID=765440 RepID=A0A0C3F3W0_PILCF|nr:hypothetical protein PILCRDRAFT_695636 [Piloderma croceum F 1598]